MGVPGARRRLALMPGGHDAITFSGCILADPPPPGMEDHCWLLTARGTRRLAPASARPVVTSLVGLHDSASFADELVAAGHPRESARRILRSGWFVRLPGTITPLEFASVFAGLGLTRGPSEVNRPDPSVADIDLRAIGGSTTVRVPGWLYTHMIGRALRPDLVETVGWRITDPVAIIERITTFVELLAPLLAEGIASLVPVATSASARLIRDNAEAPTLRPIAPDRDELLDWLIFVVSRV